MAGGSGRRMSSQIPKQFLMLGNMPVLARTINTFSEAFPSADMVVVLPEAHIAMWRDLAARFDVAAHRCVAGGAERFDSVKCGLAAVSPEVEMIAVHDGVRALASKKLIIRTMLEAQTNGACIPVMTPTDSYRMTDDNDSSHSLSRDRLRIVQTPQIFSAEILRRAYDRDYDASFTDDASVVEAAGSRIFMCCGEQTNIKITTPEDLAYAEYLLSQELVR